MSDRPVWLLDVDGVINATRPGWSAAPRSVMIVAGGTWRFRFAPALTAAIRTVALSGDAEIRWSTTWVPWARDVEAAFRLPALPEAFTSQQARTGNILNLKMAAAEHVVYVERRPLIWTDDDAVEAEMGDALRRLADSGVPVLIIAPQSKWGLQPEHMRQVEEFISRHA